MHGLTKQNGTFTFTTKQDIPYIEKYTEDSQFVIKRRRKAKICINVDAEMKHNYACSSSEVYLF
jgi:hypothetical protein